MKNKLPLLLFTFIFILGITNHSHAQCVIDNSHTQPGLYPDSLSDGTTQQFYTQDVTFVMVTDTAGFSINNFQIQNISGLPFGMVWTCNHASTNCNYDPHQSLYGCVNISGTPLLPGNYVLDVVVIATLAIVGNQTFHFNPTLTVLPASSGNSGFSMINSSGCPPLTVSFTNNTPNQQYYNWHFGNGDSSRIANPAAVVYDSSGDYVVTRKAIADTLEHYYLTSVKIDSIPNNAGFLDTPDMYILVKNHLGTIVYNSHPSLTNTNPPATFSPTALDLKNENYTIELWDEDSGFTLPDDSLGIVTIPGHGTTGTVFAKINGVGGRLKLEYTITYLPVMPVISIDTVHVYPHPVHPVIAANGVVEFCDGGSVILKSNNLQGNQWFKNGFLLTGAIDSTLLVDATGSYHTFVTNSFGCVDSSSVQTVTVFPLPPAPHFTANSNVLTSTTFNSNFTYSWLLNDTLIAGADSSSYTALSSGNYRLLVTDTNGCQRKSFPALVTVTGIESQSFLQNNFTLFPNPARGFVTVAFKNNFHETIKIQITDVMGRVVFEAQNETAKDDYIQKITTADWNKGMYFVKMKTADFSIVKKLLLE